MGSTNRLYFIEPTLDTTASWVIVKQLIIPPKNQQKLTITVAISLLVKAGGSENPTTIIEIDGGDLASILADKRLPKQGLSIII